MEEQKEETQEEYITRIHKQLPLLHEHLVYCLNTLYERGVLHTGDETITLAYMLAAHIIGTSVSQAIECVENQCSCCTNSGACNSEMFFNAMKCDTKMIVNGMNLARVDILKN